MRVTFLASSKLAGSLRHSATTNLRCCSQIPIRSFSRSTHCAEDQRNADFKHQLYASTQARIEREKADQKRFAEARQKTQGISTASTIFGLS